MRVRKVVDVYEIEDFGGLDLVSTMRKDIAYGISCENVLEIIGLLIQDYATGIIDEVCCVEEKRG